MCRFDISKINLHEEQKHFDRMVQVMGSTWWGDRTPAATIREQRRITLINRHLNPPPGSRMIEIGCGVGNITARLADAFPEIRLLGIDISEETILKAKEQNHRSNIECLVGDCLDLGGLSKQVDYIVGRSILHHLPNLHQAFSTIHAVLRSGEKIFFSEPNPYNPHTYIVGKKVLIHD